MQLPPERPAEREGQAGAGDQPGGVLPGEAGEPGGLGERQLDGGDPWRAGLPAAIRDGRVAEGYLQVSVADVAVASRGAARMVLAVAGGEGDAAGQRAADGAGAELGEGGQGGVPADAVPAPGLALVPAEHVLARFERFLRREISRRISRYWPSIPVAVIAQSLYRGPLDPFPADRRSNTASLTAWSARTAVPDGSLTW